MTHNILVVDDEPKLCDLLASALGQNNVQVFIAGNGLHALKVLEQEDIDLVISDWRMPGMDGPALLAEIKVRYPHVPVIVMTAYSTVKNAVQSMRNGAYDYIAKPFDIDELDITVAKALQFRDIMRDNARLRAELDEQAQFDSLVGDSPAFRKVLQAVDSVRDSSTTILLTGESGTGPRENWSPAPSISTAAVPTNRSWRSTARRSPKGCWKAKCSVIARARLPAPCLTGSGASSRPTRARCFSMKWAICPWHCRPRSCAPCRSG